MSTETIGSLVYERIFLNPFLDENINFSFISDDETDLLVTQVISVKEPFETGTRIPQPPILSLGKISESAFAAPVVVGIIDARRRRKYSTNN